MEMPQRKVTAIIAIVVIVAACVSIWINFRPASPRIDRVPIIAAHSALGQLLAEETIKVVNGQGPIVIVTDSDPKSSNRGRDDRWEAFHASLKQREAIRVVAVEILPVDPDEGPILSCSRPALVALMERYGAVGAIVFFRDLPVWSRVESMIPPNITPKIVALDTIGQPTKLHYGGYFTRGIMAALIGGGRENAGNTFQVYTPQNYESLPE